MGKAKRKLKIEKEIGMISKPIRLVEEIADDSVICIYKPIPKIMRILGSIILRMIGVTLLSHSWLILFIIPLYALVLYHIYICYKWFEKYNLSLIKISIFLIIVEIILIFALIPVRFALLDLLKQVVSWEFLRQF